MAAQGQSPAPFLERVLTIKFQNERLDACLKKIADRGGFTFSYNASIIDAERIVNESFERKTVRQILDVLFDGTIQYKARGKYVILTKADLSQRTDKVFNGYVVDESTGERLKNVTVYDPITLSSAVTDSYGYFQIEVPKPRSDLQLVINKQNYTDTLVTVNAKPGRLLNIPLKIDKDKLSTFADSVGLKMKRFWKKAKVFTREQINMTNVKDSIHRRTQISFVPFVGTNHALSGNVINDYSFNILGGYALGVRKVELGGIFNLDRGNVNGFQLAGTFNAVGNDVRAVQLAGVFNANRGNVSGAQLAGLYNFNWGKVEGFSAAGVVNFVRRGSDAVQLAGIGNFTIGEQEKPHAAGIFNFSTGSAQTQVAGIVNFTAKNATGFQGAGIVNFAAKNVRGVQAAGIVNFAGKTVDGAQVSSILNIAKSVHGVQVGLVNIADSARGVPIGLLSFVMKGYHKIEVSADETFFTNLAFRTGVRKFYNIISAGANPSTFSQNATLWTFGYGLGTAPKLTNNLFLNFDLTANQVVQGNLLHSLQLLNRFYVGLDYQFAKNTSLTFGATLNAYLTDNAVTDYWDISSAIKPHVFYNNTFANDVNMKMWLGGKIGVRFL